VKQQGLMFTKVDLLDESFDDNTLSELCIDLPPILFKVISTDNPQIPDFGFSSIECFPEEFNTAVSNDLLHMSEKEFKNHALSKGIHKTKFRELNNVRKKVIDKIQELEEEINAELDQFKQTYGDFSPRYDMIVLEVKEYANKRIEKAVSVFMQKDRKTNLPEAAVKILRKWIMANANSPLV
jgi:arginyl-tRNA synthetase